MSVIAQTILEQLGGNKFTAMTGARNLADLGDGLSFQLNSRMTKNSCNAVKITLTPTDTYQIKFLRIGHLQLKTIKVLDNIYCDQLQDIFTSETGLDTHL
jgi:hypothetical protein